MSGLNYGIRRSIPHFLGICVGFALMLIIVGLGIGALILNHPIIQKVVQIGGAIYMLYLAWKIIFASTQIKANVQKQALSFYQAVIFQCANPKAWIMTIGVFATFSLTNENLLTQVLLITLIFSAICAPCIMLWMYGGVALKTFLKNQRHIRVFNIITGSILALSIALIFI